MSIKTKKHFQEIRQEIIKSFMSNTNISSYDYNASNMSSFIDTLAFNRLNSDVHAQFLLNESYPTTAVTKTALYNHAYLKGYIPRSRVSSKIMLSMEIDKGNNTSSVIKIPAGTNFTSKQPSKVEFSTNEPVILELDNVTNKYKSDKFMVHGGVLRSFKFKVKEPLTDIFKIRDENIDCDTLKVTVNNTKYTVTNKTNGDSSNTIVSLRKTDDDLYQLIFADGILGKGVEADDEIVCTYITTYKDNAGGLFNFTAVDVKDGAGIDRTAVVTTYGKSTDCAEHENELELNKSIVAHNNNLLLDAIQFESQAKKIIGNNANVIAWNGNEQTPSRPNNIYIGVSTGSHISLSKQLKDWLRSELTKQTINGIYINIVDTNLIEVNCDYTFKVNSTNNVNEFELRETLTKYYNSIYKFSASFTRYGLDEMLSKEHDYIKSLKVTHTIRSYHNLNKGDNSLVIDLEGKYTPIEFSTLKIAGIDGIIEFKEGKLYQNNENVGNVIDDKLIINKLKSDSPIKFTVVMKCSEENINPSRNSILSCDTGSIKYEI